MDWQAITPELQKKLDAAHVKPAKAYGPKGDYIEGWHAMAEANAIFGFGGWSYTVTQCQCAAQGERPIGKDRKPGFGVTYTAMVRVTVGDVVREDFGAGHGYDVDLGLAHESAIKEAVTDALKRALRSFGNRFGLALYDKTRANVEFDEAPQALPVMRTEPQPALPSRKSKAESRDLYERMQKDVDASRSADEVTSLMNSDEMRADMETLPVDWEREIRERAAVNYRAHKAKPPVKSALDSLNELQQNAAE